MTYETVGKAGPTNGCYCTTVLYCTDLVHVGLVSRYSDLEIPCSGVWAVMKLPANEDSLFETTVGTRGLLTTMVSSFFAASVRTWGPGFR